MKKVKTNALRLLDQAHIDYEMKEYAYDEEHLSGEHIIHQVDLDAKQIYKTLVLKGTKGFLVCCIPVLDEINLKKLAKVSHQKSVEMVHQKELLPLTGYVHGGCSPIGLKKPFKIVIDDSAKNFKEIIFSGGKIGYQVEVELNDLEKVINYEFSDIVKD